MSETTNEWTMDAHDVSGLPLAPSVTFVLNEYGTGIVAEPPGGLIVLMLVGGIESRIVLTNTETGEVFADVLSKHCTAPSLGDEWNTITQHACEVAAALYWSMWRRQQIRKREATSTPKGGPDAG